MHSYGGRRLRACTTGVVALFMAGTATGCGVSEIIGGGTASPSPTATATEAKPTLPPKPPARSFAQTERLAKRAMAKLDGKAFTKAGCPEAQVGVGKFSALLERSRLVLGLEDTLTATTKHRWVTQSVSIRPRGRPDVSMDVVFERDRGRWCVADVTANDQGGAQYGFPADPKGRLWDRQTMADYYLKLVNSGDIAEAATFHSLDKDVATAERELREELKGVGTITIDRSVPVNRHGDFTLKATRNGEALKATLYTSEDPRIGIVTVGGLSLI